MIRLHPYDAYLLLTKKKTIKLIRKGKAYADNLPNGQFVIDGVLYQEDLAMPPTPEALRAIEEDILDTRRDLERIAHNESLVPRE